MRKKKHAAALIVVAAALAAAMPANAEPSQAGCQAYGEFVADTAQTLNGATPGGGGQFVSGVATSGPGAIADLVPSLKQLTCG